MSALKTLTTNVNKIEKDTNLDTDVTISKIEKRNKFPKTLAAAAILAIGTQVFAADGYDSWATSDDSFGDLLGTFIQWLTGNLGKTIALLGFIGTFVIYLFTHKGSVLFIGVLISLIAGGLVGIVATFFNFGANAFQIHSDDNS